MIKNDVYKNLIIINFIKSIYKNETIPLHEPCFIGNEKKYLGECIDSTYVSSVGKFVNKFEESIANYTGSKFSIATSSGTSGLHISLLLANVDHDSEVITQSLNFVAASNAILYCKAKPIFIDVDRETMGLSPKALKKFLETQTVFKNKICINKSTGRVIRACIPMHTYGHPCKVDEIKNLCDDYNIFLIEDAAESLGSHYKGKHTGTFGKLGVFSFNGNKIITAGGGGCIITDNEELAIKAKHISTTSKIPHKWNFYHDMIGYNYRMPNLNAALLLAQLENLDNFILSKRNLADKYKVFFKSINCNFFNEPKDCNSNYWLNTIILNSKSERDKFLEDSNSNGIMTRPIWTLMSNLPMFIDCQKDNLFNSIWLEERVVNLPSSVLK